MGEPSEDSRARLGAVVGGRWRLDALLGEGGFGAVYRGTDLQGGPPLAIKLLHARLGASREVRHRFRREAESAAKIGHPGIVRVLGSGEEPSGDAWIALELLEGRSLAEVLAAEGPRPLGEAARIVRDVCGALGAAHAAGIVHRDLKPDNIFLTPEGPKLLDFGVSKIFEGEDLGSLATRTGAALGTPYYMAPEQAQGKRGVDHRADLYALGVVLFELLTGERPFEDASYPMLVLKICTEPPPAVSAFRADVPPAFEGVLTRLLEKAPEARYSSCAEVIEALASFTDHDQVVRLIARPDTAARRASVLGSTLGSARTAISIDPHTGEPLVPELDAQAADAEARVRGNPLVARIAALLGVMVVVGLVAWLWLRPPAEAGGATPAAGALPEPREPLVQPLRVPEGASLAWRWINPLPRAMPAWNDVAVSAPALASSGEAVTQPLVAFVGRGGRAGRLEGGALRLWATGVDADLHGVTWVGPAQAIAVGDGGTVVALLLSGPRALASGVEVTLRDVAARGPIDVVAVGDDGTLLRMPNLMPEVVPTGRHEHLFGVHLDGDAILAVGAHGLVLRVEGDAVTIEREEGAPLRAVGGCGDAIYAVGDEVVLRREVREGRARWRELGGIPRERWFGIACDGDRVVASGHRGGVLVLVGDRGVRFDSGSERVLRGIGSVRGGPTWVVGDGGFLGAVERDRMRILTAGHTGGLFDVATLAGTLVAVGANGGLLRERDRRLVVEPRPTDAALAGLAALEDDRLVAVGDHGTLVEIGYDTTRVIEGPDAFWRDVVAADGVMLAVGTRGAIGHGPPGTLAGRTAAGEPNLWAVAGTPSDAIAVGEGGVVLGLRNGATTRLPGCGTTTLRAVHRAGDVAWIAGDEGRVYRHAEGSCALEREGGPTLHGIGPGPNGGVLAVGAEGAAYERGEDGEWSQLDLDTELELRAVHATDRDVYVAGAGGLLLRHARLR
ncbi:MAG: serine/threonine protein kinase [Myxococcales bacterium]|nr:serine/threonine protein kinase [Myxococcales bacterium]